jgi:hypothetical protein
MSNTEKQELVKAQLKALRKNMSVEEYEKALREFKQAQQ